MRTDSQKGLPMRPRSRHELSAPTVDLITGKCIPGKMIRTVSTIPLTVDMTVSCRPEPEHMQQGMNTDVLPLTKNVGFPVADVTTSTAVATPPDLGGGDERPASKKSPPDDWSESSELLPSFGGGGGDGPDHSDCFESPRNVIHSQQGPHGLCPQAWQKMPG